MLLFKTQIIIGKENFNQVPEAFKSGSRNPAAITFPDVIPS